MDIQGIAFTYSASNLNSPLQVQWVKSHKNIPSTGFYSHFSTNFGLIWTKWTINYRSMLNKLGITSGARMARIFMDLQRESEHVQIHANPCHPCTWGYTKLNQHSRVVDGSYGPYWAKIGLEMAPETCIIFLWVFSQLTCKRLFRFEAWRTNLDLNSNLNAFKAW